MGTYNKRLLAGLLVWYVVLSLWTAYAPVDRQFWFLSSILPSALVLGLLSLFGALVWLWAVLSILLNQTVPRSAWAYLSGVQRYTYRLLAYQAALVDEYPPFALSELHELTSAPSAQ